MRSLRVLFLAGLLLMPAGCQLTRTSAPGRAVRVTPLLPAGQRPLQVSGLRSPLRAVVRDAAGLAKFWDLAFPDAGTRPQRPEVDFTRHSVIVTALGERTSGGYQIRVDAARANGTGLDVSVRSSSPRGGVVTAVMTQPADLVAVDWVGSPEDVRFVER